MFGGGAAFRVAVVVERPRALAAVGRPGLLAGRECVTGMFSVSLESESESFSIFAATSVRDGFLDGGREGLAAVVERCFGAVGEFARLGEVSGEDKLSLILVGCFGRSFG